VNEITITPPQMTKSAIQTAGARYAQELLDMGEHDPLAAYIQLRALKDAVDTAVKALEPDAMNRAEEYSRDARVEMGVRFQVRSGRELWDYSHDQKWQEFRTKEQEWAKQRKEWESVLRGLSGDELVNPATGEYVTPANLKGYAKSSLALTFPKE